MRLALYDVDVVSRLQEMKEPRSDDHDNPDDSDTKNKTNTKMVRATIRSFLYHPQFPAETQAQRRG